ncbi:uncharacterized protein LOC121372392 [Gigantopelta aegis]|uniref:uncharacterized protein LOC121372392 n=1 Tax=Gigantopelta aegis TaxID=1735272 RepID=UPI001B887839|nr:uncharacterized protein LOC121372392 [Gigantopelta aegis]
MSCKPVLSKWVAVGVNVLIIVSCACVFIPFGYIDRYLNSNCILHADMVRHVPFNDTVLIINVDKSSWGDHHNCNFVTYMPVVVAIHAFIWTWFFVYVRKSLKEERSEITLLLPVSVLHGTLFVCMFVASCIISTGFHNLCENVHILYRFKSASCSDIAWSTSKDQRKHHFYSLFLLSVIFSWVVTVFVLVQCILSSLIVCKDSFTPDKSSSSEPGDTRQDEGTQNLVADVHASSTGKSPIATGDGDLSDEVSYQDYKAP